MEDEVAAALPQDLIPVKDPGPAEPEEGIALCLSGWVRLRVKHPFPISQSAVERARNVPARMAKLDDGTQADLIDWGYVIADTALRRWVYRDAHPPTRLPATEG